MNPMNPMNPMNRLNFMIFSQEKSILLLRKNQYFEVVKINIIILKGSVRNVDFLVKS